MTSRQTATLRDKSRSSLIIQLGLVPLEVAATMGNYAELSKKMARQVPNTKLVEIENCGHGEIWRRVAGVCGVKEAAQLLSS